MIIGNTYNDGGVKWRVVNNSSPSLSWNGGTLPIGTIVPYAINNDLPEGFLICNGAAISREEYSDLFNKIGTTYGSGDGSTTFNVPDLRNKFLEGSTTAGTNIAAGLPNIKGEIQNRKVVQGSSGTYALVSNYDNKSLYTTNSSYPSGMTNVSLASTNATTVQSIVLDASRSSSIYSDNINTVQPPALTTIYIIKALLIESDFTYLNEILDNKLEREQCPMFNKIDKITTSGTYITPISGWYKITAKGGGGGGSGAYVVTSSNYYLPGGGGGEGGTVKAYKYLTKGTSCVCSIGAGGTGGTAAFNDTSKINTNDSVGGGNTTVTIGSLVINAYGGNRAYKNNGSGIGGAGGYASSVTGDNAVSYKIINGMAGQPGIMQNFIVSSAEHKGGLGGGYRTYVANYPPAYGEGGKGGNSYNTAVYTQAGSNGSQGVVIFEYFDPELQPSQ